jgi:hypothetical protein
LEYWLNERLKQGKDYQIQDLEDDPEIENGASSVSEKSVDVEEEKGEQKSPDLKTSLATSTKQNTLDVPLSPTKLRKKSILKQGDLNYPNISFVIEMDTPLSKGSDSGPIPSCQMYLKVVSSSGEAVFSQDCEIKKYKNIVKFHTKLDDNFSYISICAILDSDIGLFPQLSFR